MKHQFINLPYFATHHFNLSLFLEKNVELLTSFISLLKLKLSIVHMWENFDTTFVCNWKLLTVTGILLNKHVCNRRLLQAWQIYNVSPLLTRTLLGYSRVLWGVFECFASIEVSTNLNYVRTSTKVGNINSVILVYSTVN